MAWSSNPLKLVLPLAVFAAVIGAWEAAVRLQGIPPYILPSPSLIGATMIADWPLLRASLLTTLGTTLLGLALAVVGGVVLALLLSLSRIVEYSLYPIAIAPLLLIYMPQDAAVLTCAWLVAFFPVLSNTMLGLQSVDRNLMELFQLYGAPASRKPLALLRSRLKALWYLRRPAALPAFLTGLRIAGGLSLIGAVVAEMAAGSAGAGSGLAYRIIESQYRLNIPRLFAALVLLALTGIGLYLLLAGISHRVLRRWHESALAQEK